MKRYYVTAYCIMLLRITCIVSIQYLLRFVLVPVAIAVLTEFAPASLLDGSAPLVDRLVVPGTCATSGDA